MGANSNLGHLGGGVLHGDNPCGEVGGDEKLRDENVCGREKSHGENPRDNRGGAEISCDKICGDVENSCEIPAKISATNAPRGENPRDNRGDNFCSDNGEICGENSRPDNLCAGDSHAAPSARDLRELLAIAKRAALAGGREILRHLGDFAVTRKGDNSPVTDADIAANAAIARELAASGHAVCSEEAILPHAARVAAARRGGFWLIDPLDGTRGFVRGSGEFCVCVAFIDAGANAALGVIFSPILARMWAGVVADADGTRRLNAQLAASANAFLAGGFGADFNGGFGADFNANFNVKNCQKLAKTPAAQPAKNQFKNPFQNFAATPAHIAPNSNLGADFAAISREFSALLDESFRAEFSGDFRAVLGEITAKNHFETGDFSREFGANSNLSVLPAVPAPAQNHANLRRVFAAAPDVLYGSGEGASRRFCECFGLGGGALGSALKFALLAAQQSRILLKTYGTSLWDTAAGEALLNATGGGIFALNSAKNPAKNLQNFVPNSAQNPAPNSQNHAQISQNPAQNSLRVAQNHATNFATNSQNPTQISPRVAQNPAQNHAQNSQNSAQNPAKNLQNSAQNPPPTPPHPADFLTQINYLSANLQNPHFIALSRGELANLPLYARFLRQSR